MMRNRLENGLLVPLSAEENAARDAEEAGWKLPTGNPPPGAARLADVLVSKGVLSAEDLEA